MAVVFDFVKDIPIIYSLDTCRRIIVANYNIAWLIKLAVKIPLCVKDNHYILLRKGMTQLMHNLEESISFTSAYTSKKHHVTAKQVSIQGDGDISIIYTPMKEAQRFLYLLLYGKSL